MARGGTAPDTRRPSQRWQATPPGDGPPPPTRHAAPTGHAGQGDSAGPPHPHSGAHSTWVADPNSPPSGQAVGGGTAPDLRRPFTTVEGTPPGDALPPPPQRATPAPKGARCGAGAGSPRPHRPHPGHTGRRTLVARSRGRAAGRGTAPDTRRPSQRRQATPPGDGPPPPPRHAAPTGHAGQGDSVGPPHPHTRAYSTRVADRNSPPSGRAVGGGTAPDLRRPSQRWKAPPPGTPFRHPHSEQRQPARGHAVGPVLGPHARTNRTRVAEPWLPAPEDGRPGEGQRLTPDAPHNGGRPPPPGTAPHQPHGTQPPQGIQAKGTVLGPQAHTPAPTARGWQTPTARPVGGQSGEGQRLTSDAPHNGGRHSPRGRPFRHPHSEQRRPARAHAVGPVLGPHARTDRTRDTRVAEPWLPAPEDGWPGEGQRLTPDAPYNGGRPAPPGTAHHHPHGAQPPQGMQAKGTVIGPHTHIPAPAARGWRTPTARPVGGQSGEGQRLTSDAPHNGGRHPPRGRPSATPTATNAGPQRAHAVEPVLGLHARTDRTRNTRVAVPRLPASEVGRSGERHGLLPGAPHNSGRPGPPGDGPPPHQPRGTQPPEGMQAKGTVLGPYTHTPVPTARGLRTPTSPPSGRVVAGGGAPDLRRLSQQQPQPRQGETEPDRPPPPARQTEQGTGAGHAEGHGPRGTALPAPVPGPRDVRTPHHPGGGGADAAGARAHTHAKGTRGLPEGQPDRARGTHRPRGRAYQRARVKDTGTGQPATRSAGHAGREGGNGRDTTPGTGPSPPNRPRAPRTHGRGTAPTKAVVAHCVTPQPLG